MTVAWFEEFARAIADGEPVYRRCEACENTGWPPRHTCPSCGEPAMRDQPLSRTARVVAATAIHVTTPRFKGETPYTVAICEFESEAVRLTGQVRGTAEVEPGQSVGLGVENRDDGGWVLTFSPIE